MSLRSYLELSLGFFLVRLALSSVSFNSFIRAFDSQLLQLKVVVLLRDLLSSRASSESAIRDKGKDEC